MHTLSFLFTPPPLISFLVLLGDLYEQKDLNQVLICLECLMSYTESQWAVYRSTHSFMILIITCLFCHTFYINTMQYNTMQCSMSHPSITVIETIKSIGHHANLLLTMLTSYHNHTPLSSFYPIPTDHLIQKKEDKVMNQITSNPSIGTALEQLSHHNHQSCIVLVSIVPTRSNYCIFLCRTSY